VIKTQYCDRTLKVFLDRAHVDFVKHDTVKALGARRFPPGGGFPTRPRFHLLGAGRILPRQFTRRSHDAVIRVYDAAGNVIATHEHKGDFKECIVPSNSSQPGNMLAC
jgi:hypothetical protein